MGRGGLSVNRMSRIGMCCLRRLCGKYNFFQIHILTVVFYQNIIIPKIIIIQSTFGLHEVIQTVQLRNRLEYLMNRVKIDFAIPTNG
jgi:hypothetical protein